MQKECSFSSWNHLNPSLPESASAVSQIAEEEHSWGKQMKDRAKERMWARWEKEKRNLRECSIVQSVSRWLMSEVRGRWFLASRQRPVWTWNVTEASNMARLELKNLLALGFLQQQATVREVLTADFRNFPSRQGSEGDPSWQKVPH